jgi:hypothetical protein
MDSSFNYFDDSMDMELFNGELEGFDMTPLPTFAPLANIPSSFGKTIKTETVFKAVKLEEPEPQLKKRRSLMSSDEKAAKAKERYFEKEANIRMERNRESAQLSRDRKKVQVASLEVENGRLLDAFRQSELERNQLIQKVRELSERLERVNKRDRVSSPPLSPDSDPYVNYLSDASASSTQSNPRMPSSLMNIGLTQKSNIKTINTSLRTSTGESSLVSAFNSLGENKLTVFGLSPFSNVFSASIVSLAHLALYPIVVSGSIVKTPTQWTSPFANQLTTYNAPPTPRRASPRSFMSGMMNGLRRARGQQSLSRLAVSLGRFVKK